MKLYITTVIILVFLSTSVFAQQFEEYNQSFNLHKENVLTEEEALKLANEWVQAWNSHDLDEIMSHYHDDVVLVSPVVAQLLGEPSGTLRGKQALRSYFEKGLQTYPDLAFKLVDVLWGLDTVILYYRNQRGTMTGEYMKIDSSGLVRRVVANYSR